MVVFSALMLWKLFMVHNLPRLILRLIFSKVASKSESPVVVVLSGSMEPAFQRGDILWLSNYDDPVRAGEIVVFKVKGRDIPIVHRVLQVHEKYIISILLP